MDEIDREFENFTIDTELLPESFLAFKITLTTTLADQSFIHTITSEYKPNHNTNLNFNPFTYTADTT